jgi:uncharacterized RDD family membrane protein YckC
MEPTVVTYAGFWRRFVASLIDGFVLGIVEFVIFIPILGVLGVGIGMSAMNAETNVEENAAMILAFILGPILFAVIIASVAGWLYFALMECSSRQATLGKMALGIRVTDLVGGRISFGRATGRYFGKIVSAAIIYIGFIMAGFTQQKQALHDIMAGCLVVNNK